MATQPASPAPNGQSVIAALGDIQKSLQALLLELRNDMRPMKPIQIIGPWSVTLSGTTEMPLLSRDFITMRDRIVNLEVKVRDPSTSSYIALRTPNSSRWEFHTAGDYYKFDIPHGYYLPGEDARKFRVFADVGAPVLEVIAYTVGV